MARRELICAGVIPYYVTDSGVVFILGRSRGGNRLGSFTGKANLGESELDTAAREFCEETLGVILSEDEMREKLREVGPEHTIRSLTPTGKPCFTYICPVPASNTYPDTFRRVRGLLEAQSMLPFHLAEFSEIKAIPGCMMLDDVKPTWIRMGLINTQDAWNKIESVINMHGKPKLDDAWSDAE